MADSIDFDISEMNSLVTGFAASSAAAVANGSKIVRASALKVVAHAQRFVPVDTSATKNSIHASAPGGGALTAFSLEAEMGPTTEYAPYLEYGTSRMAPFAFMGPALDIVTPEFVAAAALVAGLG